MLLLAVTDHLLIYQVPELIAKENAPQLSRASAVMPTQVCPLNNAAAAAVHSHATARHVLVSCLTTTTR